MISGEWLGSAQHVSEARVLACCLQISLRTGMVDLAFINGASISVDGVGQCLPLVGSEIV